MPSDNPAGGINFQAVQTLTNPRYIAFFYVCPCPYIQILLCSTFDIQLGTIVFDLYAQDVYLGQGTGQNIGIVRRYFVYTSKNPKMTVADDRDLGRARPHIRGVRRRHRPPHWGLPRAASVGTSLQWLYLG